MIQRIYQQNIENYCLITLLYFSDFGNKEVQTLVEELRHGLENAEVDIFSAEMEWPQLCSKIYQRNTSMVLWKTVVNPVH